MKRSKNRPREIAEYSKYFLSDWFVGFHLQGKGDNLFRPKYDFLFYERIRTDDFNVGSLIQGDTPASFALG